MTPRMIEISLSDPKYVKLIDECKGFKNLFETSGLHFRYMKEDSIFFYVVDEKRYMLFRIKHSI